MTIFMSSSSHDNHLNYALSNYKKSFFVVEFLGLEISYTYDSCVVCFPVNKIYFGPNEAYHNGLLSTVMDIAMAHLTKKKAGSAGATIELTSKYLNPLIKGPARCEAKFIVPNSIEGFLEAKIWDVEGVIISCASAIWNMPK